MRKGMKISMTRKIQAGILTLLLISVSGRNLRGQALPSHPLSLGEAIDYALRTTPPSAPQWNRWKARGMVWRWRGHLICLKLIPSIRPIAPRRTKLQGSGCRPPSHLRLKARSQPNSATSFWDAQAGALLSWEPVDFGLRHAEVEQARSVERKSDADVELTRLQLASAVGGYFLNAVAAQQTVLAAQAEVKRWQVFDNVVRVLVRQELRPGVDGSRADAELAMARTQLFQAQAAEQQAEAILASLMGTAGESIQVEAHPLLGSPPASALPPAAPAGHPLARDQQASVEELRARERVIDHTDYPRFFVQAEAFARGSGANPDGAFAGGLRGLGFDRGDWLAGVSVVFPNLFDFSARRDQKRMAEAQERSQEARYQQTLQDLTGQAAAAQAAYQAAARIAQNTPIALEAARQAESQARVRYQSGLTNLVEVAEGESLLAQAERDDAVARIGVWRGLFGVAVAQGNLESFRAVLKAVD